MSQHYKSELAKSDLGLVEKAMQNFVFTLTVACVAGRRKGVRKVKMSAGSEGEGTACKDAIVFFVFYIHQTNVKILIGQI